MKVELGAGSTRKHGWCAVDMNVDCRPTVVASAMALPFRDGTVSELSAVDVLEHISYRDTDRALGEWARVCKPRAGVYIQVPAGDVIMRWFCEEPARLKVPDDLPPTPLAGAAWRLLGGHADGHYVAKDGDFRYNAHYSLWSRDSLRQALERAGFAVVQIKLNGHPNLLALAKRQ